MEKLLNKSTLFAACLALATATGNVKADLSIAQGPLFLSVNAEPNIMFILDDSGSMHWELMPDGYTDVAYYMFPRGNDVYSNSDYRNFVPAFDNTRGFSVAMRSPDVNKTFYNPEITYTPWAKDDGTQYPPAVKTAAYYNPEKTGVGSLDLTTDLTMSAYWRYCDGPDNSDCDETDRWNDVDSTSDTFYPAVYNRYDGTGDIWDPANYEKIKIVDDAATTYSTDNGLTDRSARTDCVAGVCTGLQEMQNFANWFTYYRSRILLARAGVGFAFAQQGSNMRVGFGAINEGQSNVDGVNTHTIIDGVRKFEGSDREDWFESLYEHPIPTSGTPLRTSLQDAGEYFSRASNSSSSPWDSTPGVNDTLEEYACRQSYTILMSDGYWNGDSPGVGNVDGTENTSTTPEAYESTSTVNPFDHPFTDTHNNTLADVALKYWYDDLRTDLEDKVPTNPQDAAYWQHMVTFTVGLGVFGSIDPVADWDDLKDGTLAWPQPNTNPGKIDDMFHAAVNGRGGFFSASNPTEFATALNESLTNIVSRNSSASAVATNSTRISSDTLIYQGRFNSGNWTGQLYAFPISSDGSIGSEVWEASTLIPSETAVGSRTRNIVTYDGSTGVDFEYDNLNGTQKAALDADILGVTDSLGADRVDYLRGITAEEGNNGGPFRNRVSLLGDIVNSDPFYVATADFGYYNLSENSGNEGLDYRVFREDADYLSRTPMLYVGANDGMLHALNADNGNELFAYVPENIYGNLTDLTSPDYDHKFYVDGSPRVGDAYLPVSTGTCPLTATAPNNGFCWKSVLVGSTGAGGKSVFALDVTDPDNFDAGNVMWEFTHSELGTTLGQPTIVRLEKAPYWYAIFGNGYNSTSHTARLFIVELATGNVAEILDTEVGSAADENGLASPQPVDLNGDRITDVIYAGDLHGNMWKFDVSGNNWGFSYKQGNTPKPLFQACETGTTSSACATTDRQPITVKPNVGAFPNGTGVMVYFGTGKYFENDDALDVGPSSQMQSFYGVRDNGSQITGSRDTLQVQSIEYEVTSGTLDYRVTSENAVNYASQDGYYLDLVSSANGQEGERVVSNAILRRDRIIFTTSIPSQDACDWGGESWLMELDAVNGTALTYAVIDVNGDGIINDLDKVDIDGDGNPDRFVSGKRMDGLGEPGAIISAGDVEYKYISTSTGAINVTLEQGGGEDFARQSWIQIQ
jgi:type IV pilus assembly protein PilY1